MQQCTEGRGYGIITMEGCLLLKYRCRW